MERAFERGGESIKNKYTTLAKKLHENFQARRTIMDWGIEYKKFCWTQEVERLKKFEFVGEYFLDIRASEPASKKERACCLIKLKIALTKG